MPEVCRHCHGTGFEPDGVAELADWLMSRGHLVTHDWLTDTAGAAAVLRIKPGSLRTMRCYFGGLTVVPRGRHRLYSIAELAQRTRQRP